MIKVRGLSKIFQTSEGRVQAVRGISFTVAKGEFYTLLGPSGCGKSTTLRCIAGLENPDGGEIFIDDVPVVAAKFFLPPHERDISMVFQSYAIWPHMTVFKNVEFPLKQMKPRPSRQERKERVLDALSRVQMEQMANRSAPQLSGGQQQRVALARALVCSPKVMLLDEPLSNLDAKLREELRLEIKDLVVRLGITTIYVTHDQLEALVMSDRIAVMLNGEIAQEADPKELYIRPANMFVAQFVGKINYFAGTVVETGADAGLVENPLATFRCPLPAGVGKGDRVTVAVRPQFFVAAKGGAPGAGENVLEGRVDRAIFVGDSIHGEVMREGKIINVQLPLTTDIGKGDAVFLTVEPRYCRVFPGSFP